MNNDIKLLTRPGLLEDDALRSQVEKWFNDRYVKELNEARQLVGKRVKFKKHNSTMLGEVMAVTICLDDTQLYRLEVKLDSTDVIVNYVSKDGIEVSDIFDEDIFHVGDFKKCIRSTKPEYRIKIGETTHTGDERDAGRTVRVIDASRHPGTFLKEGIVRQVFVCGFNTQYAIEFNDGRHLTYHDNEVRFL